MLDFRHSLWTTVLKSVKPRRTTHNNALSKDSSISTDGKMSSPCSGDIGARKKRKFQHEDDHDGAKAAMLPPTNSTAKRTKATATRAVKPSRKLTNISSNEAHPYVQQWECQEGDTRPCEHCGADYDKSQEEKDQDEAYERVNKLNGKKPKKDEAKEFNRRGYKREKRCTDKTDSIRMAIAKEIPPTSLPNVWKPEKGFATCDGHPGLASTSLIRYHVALLHQLKADYEKLSLNKSSQTYRTFIAKQKAEMPMRLFAITFPDEAASAVLHAP